MKNNNVLFEDILDDIDITDDTSVVDKLSVDDNTYDPDDASHFAYTFILSIENVNQPKIAQFREYNEYFRKLANFIKKANKIIGYICQNNVAISECSNVIFYYQKLSSNFEDPFDNIKSPYIKCIEEDDSFNADFYYYGKMRFSITSDFKSVKTLFVFLCNLFFNSKITHIDIYKSINNEWQFENKYTNGRLTNLTIKRTDITDFIQNNFSWKELNETSNTNILNYTIVSYLKTYTTTAFKIASIFIDDNQLLIDSFNKSYMFKFNEPFVSSLSNQYSNNVFNNYFFNTEDSLLYNKFKNSKITFFNIFKNNPDPKTGIYVPSRLYIVEQITTNHSIYTIGFGSKSDNISRYYITNSPIPYNNFRFVYNSISGHVQLYIYLGMIFNDKDKNFYATMFRMDLMLIKTENKEHPYNISTAYDFLTYANLLFDNCLTEDEIKQSAKELCEFASENRK